MATDDADERGSNQTQLNMFWRFLSAFIRGHNSFSCPHARRTSAILATDVQGSHRRRRIGRVGGGGGAGRRGVRGGSVRRRGRFWAAAPRLLPSRGTKPSITASTFCCAAASTCWISTRAWACATGSGFTASFISSSRAGAFPCCAAAGCRRRCISPARSCGEMPGAAPTRSASRARWPPCAASARAGKDLDRISMLDWLLAEAPDAARHRPLLAPGAGERRQRGPGPHGRRPRLSGLLAGLSGARRIPMRWACPPFRWASFTRAMPGEASATCASISAAPVERIDAEGFVVGGERRTAEHYICALPFERLDAVGLPAPRIRAFAHHRRSPVVRPRNHHPAARHATRPDHAMDVQQGPRALPATGGQRLARPNQPVARRDYRSGGRRLAPVLPARSAMPTC